MQGKKVFFAEWAYVFGILALALGTALMEHANFGMSMVVAPAYLLHLKISQFFPAYTFGMSEYVLQAVLLIAIIAAECGNQKALNLVLLGMLSRHLDFSEEAWKNAIAACVPAKTLEINLAAFARGRALHQ